MPRSRRGERLAARGDGLQSTWLAKRGWLAGAFGRLSTSDFRLPTRAPKARPQLTAYFSAGNFFAAASRRVDTISAVIATGSRS